MNEIIHNMKIEGIYRRPIPREDWFFVREWRNDPEVFIFMGTNREISLDEHLNWFDIQLKGNSASLILGYYFNHELLACTRIETSDRDFCEISIIVNPKYRKMGVAFFCVKDTLDYFFSTAQNNQKSVLATIHLNNYASKRLFEKLGFVVESIEDRFLVLKKVIE